MEGTAITLELQPDARVDPVHLLDLPHDVLIEIFARSFSLEPVPGTDYGSVEAIVTVSKKFRRYFFLGQHEAATRACKKQRKARDGVCRTIARHYAAGRTETTIPFTCPPNPTFVMPRWAVPEGEFDMWLPFMSSEYEIYFPVFKDGRVIAAWEQQSGVLFVQQEIETDGIGEPGRGYVSGEADAKGYSVRAYACQNAPVSDDMMERVYFPELLKSANMVYASD